MHLGFRYPRRSQVAPCEVFPNVSFYIKRNGYRRIVRLFLLAEFHVPKIGQKHDFHHTFPAAAGVTYRHDRNPHSRKGRPGRRDPRKTSGSGGAPRGQVGAGVWRVCSGAIRGAGASLSPLRRPAHPQSEPDLRARSPGGARSDPDFAGDSRGPQTRRLDPPELRQITGALCQAGARGRVPDRHRRRHFHRRAAWAGLTRRSDCQYRVGRRRGPLAGHEHGFGPRRVP
jgi:hypothetical protein